MIEILVSIAVVSYPVTHVALVAVATTFVLSGIGDLYFDLHYWYRRLWLSWMWRKKDWERLTLERLEAREQQKIAILVPAWNEGEVIGHMLRNACETILYRNYDIFVGTYPNDEQTQAAVDTISTMFPQVHKVVAPDPGPSTKAENLNHMYQYLAEYERQTGQRYSLFEVVVGHDSEDIIHPLSLLMYNYLIPRKDMIQIPVFPIPMPWHYFTHWTYADEFAENHTRILVSREYGRGFVPSAGVGTAYTRRAFDLISWRYAGDVFSPTSLTEDYELGLRLHLEGIRAAFVSQKMQIPPHVKVKGTKKLSEWIATQAMFPTSFEKAVRQKTRWNIGIVLQGWANVGWQGSPGMIVNLLHDRKPVVTSLISVLAYPILAYYIAYELFVRLVAWELPPLVEHRTILWNLIVVASIFMVWRLGQRAMAVAWVYGVGPGLLSILRSPWANLINFVAMIRALDQYIGKRIILGEAIAWDKTTHEFPYEEMPIKSEVQTTHSPCPSSSTAAEVEQRVEAFRKRIKATSPEERRKAIRDLGKAEISRALHWLGELVDDPSWLVRAEMCRAFSFARLPASAPYLERAATDSDWTVRSNAVKALSKMGDEGEAALLRILKGSDRYAREAALAMLEQEGFLETNLTRLDSDDQLLRARARRFFMILEDFGPSPLAREMLKATGSKKSTMAGRISDPIQRT
jgi:bacteriophage N4 adsorption protein B